MGGQCGGRCARLESNQRRRAGVLGSRGVARRGPFANTRRVRLKHGRVDACRGGRRAIPALALCHKGQEEPEPLRQLWPAGRRQRGRGGRG